ncbi:MAG TPA: DsrE family protein, partial [Acidimicrobiales bacterium]|nr:DsrE family protein [Acidimicrobiales bacterium]
TREGHEMADGNKVVINLSTGLEDPERVLVAFLVGGAALDAGKQVAMFLTKEAVRVAQKGVAVGTSCDGCPPLERLFEQFTEKGGELLVCPICFNAKKLDEAQLISGAELQGTVPMWSWIGDEAATTFSY